MTEKTISCVPNATVPTCDSPCVHPVDEGLLDEAASAFREVLELTSASWSTSEYAEYLEALSASVLARDEAARAAVLLGAAHAFRAAEGLKVSWYVEERAERVREGALRAIDAAEFNRAFATGTSLSVSDAVEFALLGVVGRSDTEDEDASQAAQTRADGSTIS